MAIGNDPLVGKALSPVSEQITEWIEASHELEQEVGRVEILGCNSVNMSFHNLWIDNKWASILFSSRYEQDYRGPLVYLSVNYQTPDDQESLIIEDFQALPSRGRVSFKDDVRPKDEAGSWEVNNLSGPLFSLEAVTRSRFKVEVLTGHSYNNSVWDQPSNQAALLRNTPRIHQLSHYLSLLNRSTLLPKVTRVTRKNVQ